MESHSLLKPADMSDPGPQNDLEWLVIFLVYNNSTYDIEKGQIIII